MKHLMPKAVSLKMILIHFRFAGLYRENAS